MSDDKATPSAEAQHPPVESEFGKCCTELKEAINGEDFDPLITEGEDGVLYMAVGLIDMEEDEPGLVDHPLFFCPFCGAKLQTADDVKAKVGADDDGTT